MNPETIIEKLGGNHHWKKHTCGKLIGCKGCEKEDRITIKPILIGDVLYKMNIRVDEKNRLTDDFNTERLLYLWSFCGFTRSLQEIAEDRELINCDQKDCNDGNYPLGSYEDGEIDWGACPTCKPLEGTPGKIEQLKPEAKALFEFLEEVFN